MGRGSGFRVGGRLSYLGAGGALWALALAASLTLAGPAAQAAFPGFNGKIACSGVLALELPLPLLPFQSRLEIFDMNGDGTGDRRLMTNTNSDFSPRYSADGRQIAFIRDRNVWKMNAEGGGARRLTTTDALESDVGSWSPDGRQILFQTQRDGDSEIYKMNADGTNQTNITNHPGGDTQAGWSPDGTKIVFQSNREASNADVYTMSPDGSNVVNLTAPSLAEESAPTWAPDGRQIAFQSDRSVFPRAGIARNLEIFTMSAVDGSGITQLTFSDFDGGAGTSTANLTGFDLRPAWSPEGDQIVFHSGRAADFRHTGSPGIIGQWEVYKTDAVEGDGLGGGVTRLTQRAGNDERCDWQPVPRKVAPGPDPAPGGRFSGCPSKTTNEILGSAGNDPFLNGTPLGDRIFAGTGNDKVDGLPGKDCIDLGPGNDTGQGGDGNDLVLGGVGKDKVSGSAGKDKLKGGSGNDDANGGTGDDDVFGDAGNDKVNGAFGDDRLHGGSGADRVVGSRGKDRINGGAGSDRLGGDSSNDRLAGDSGNDRVSGGSGNDRLRGDSGSDRVNGGSGRDNLGGGLGNDTIGARDGQRDVVSCGKGRDSVTADRIDRVARDCERVSRR